MTPFTLVMAYYDNPDMFGTQLLHCAALPVEMRKALTVIVVDDGSPTWPALEAIDRIEDRFDVCRFDLQIWRMQCDVRWNQDACRNVGVREARTQWVLLTDMDHVVPRATWERLMGEKLNKHTVYRFGRVSAPNMEPYKPHPNSWAMTAKKYWQIGGYDEALAGNYGTDGDFLTRARAVAGEPIELPEALVRYPREVVPDASTTTLERKSLEDKVRISNIIKARKAHPDWRPLHFNFPCERVL